MTYKVMDYAATKYGFPLKIEEDDKDFDETYCGIPFVTYEIIDGKRKRISHAVIRPKNGNTIDYMIKKIINDSRIDVFSVEHSSRGVDSKLHHYIRYYVPYTDEEDE